MARRYEARPRANFIPFDEDMASTHIPTVDECRGPVPTGLLDHRGHEYHRLPEPIGFAIERKDTTHG